MKLPLIALASLLILASPASAQAPPAAGRGPSFSVSAGYTYVSVGLPSSDRVGLIGPEVSLTLDLGPHLGLTTDFGYARRSHVLGTTRHADLLSYMAGPVIYPVRFRRWAIDGHLLAGGTRITGVVPVQGRTPITGFVNDVSWVFGSNIEFRVPGGINLRAAVDYIRASFFDSSLSIQRQGSIRVGLSVVYRFRTGRPR